MTEGPKPRQRRRRWILIGAIALGLLLVIGIAAPRFAAGWIAKAQLERLGIANEGVTSLAIRVWDSRIDLGAVEFWGADAEPGRVDGVSLTYDVNNLFSGRALVDRLRIRGIDIRVTRDDEGRITVNGIELAELLGPQADEAEEETEGSRELAFGVGLDGFLLEASRALLETEVGGTLLVEIDRLVVEDIRSWDPDHPAVIDLTARANDIEIEADAQAHLFSDTIMVDAHVRLDSVDLDKVTRFTGPLGFERREGEVDIDLAISMQLEPDGRVMMAGHGDITHEGAALARPDLTYSVEEHRIDLYGAVIAEPVATEREEDASVIMRVAGDAQVRSRQVEVSAPGSGRLTFDGAQIHLANLSALRDPEGRIAFEVAPRIEVMAPEVAGPLDFETPRMAFAMSALSGIVDGEAVALRGAGTADIGQANLVLAGAEDGPGPTLGAGSLRTAVDDLAVAITPKGSEISGTVTVEAGDLAADLPAEAGRAAAEVNAGALELVFSALEVAATEAGVQLEIIGTTEIAGLEARLVDGPELKLERVSSDLDTVDLAIDPADGAASLASVGSIELTGLEAGLPGGSGRPAGTAGLARLGVSLDRMTAEVGSEPPRWALGSSIEVEGFDAAIEGDSAGSLRLASLALAGLEADQTLAIGASDLTLAGLEIDASDRTIQALVGTQEAEATEDDAVAIADTARSEASSPPPPNSGPALRLAELTIERPALIRFADTSVDPPMEVETEFGVEIAQLDTADPSQRADLRLDATINEKAELALSGWAALADPPDFELEVDLRDLQLGLASPYAADAVGMDIESGEFGTATAVTSSGGELAGQIDLVIDDLVLVPVSETAAEEASSALGVPVTAAVGLLEDSEGRIELGLPVSGTVEEPNVDISEAVNKALAGTIETLFPPTAIAGMLMSESGSIEFRPIPFQAGSAELSGEAREVIDGFVALLNEKPRLEVLACGRATSADAGQPGGEEPADEPAATDPSAPGSEADAGSSERTSDGAADALVGLAQARAGAVETYLVEEQGLAPDRVRECRPRHNPDDAGPPRVDLTLT